MQFAILACLALAVVVIAQQSDAELQRRGIQMRVTDKGLGHAVKIGVALMKEDLNGKVLPKVDGSMKYGTYKVENVKLDKVEVENFSLRTLAGQGIEVVVSNMRLHVEGRLSYSIKKWFFHISDATDMKADVVGISFRSTFHVAAKPDGKPSISTASCKANIGDLTLRFKGGASWIYKIASSAFSGKLEDLIADTICKEAKEQVAKRTDAEMKTFSVVKAIDKWAKIDYSLTSSPLFTSSYMDAFLKGKFISRNSPAQETKLRIPSFPTSSDSDKMVYFWLTDYTLNTAGEVYHNSNALKLTLTRNDPDVPFVLRQFMSTTPLMPLIPKLYSKYPGKPLKFVLTSYKAPTVNVVQNAIALNIYAKAAVQVDLGSNATVDVFSLILDVNATGSVAMKKEFLTGTITDTSFKATVAGSTIGKFTFPTNNPIVKLIIRAGILTQINPLLQRGIPLPKVDDISFVNSTITLQPDVIRIGTDIDYTPLAV